VLVEPNGAEREDEVIVGQVRCLHKPGSSDLEVVYGLLDLLAKQLHFGRPGELVQAVCILRNGEKVLLHLPPGTNGHMASGKGLFIICASMACLIFSWSLAAARWL